MKIENPKELAAKTGTGLGLSAAAIVWLFATFALQRDYNKSVEQLEKMQQQIHEIHTQVVVLDAIRQNTQQYERNKYE